MATVRRVGRQLESGPDPLLFQKQNLQTALHNRLTKARERVEALDADYLLQTSEHDLVDELVAEYGDVDCPVLRRDEVEALPVETGYLPASNRFGDSTRMNVALRRFVVPFAGSAEVFQLQASQWSLNPPRAVVTSHRGGGELRITLHGEHHLPPDPAQIRSALEGQLDKIEQYLGWSGVDIAGYQTELRSMAGTIRARREEILRERDLEAAIGIPVRRRPDSDRYHVPLQRRRIQPSARGPAKRATPFVPEPAMDDNAYEEVLTVLRSSRNALERNPSTAARLSEEGIRDLLLVNLNAQFEGRAAGEMFNGAGKTDILIRERDRNIFIAECKIWRGPKTITDALDQLLGYLVWRDTKAALMLFIRRGEPSAIIAKALAAIERHPSHKRTVDRGSPAERSDFIVAASGDAKREIRLAFLPFVLPT